VNNPVGAFGKVLAEQNVRLTNSLRWLYDWAENPSTSKIK
jgi:hypothetical protein